VINLLALCVPFVALLLFCCGDLELNPPFIQCHNCGQRVSVRVNGEVITSKTANQQGDARADIYYARGFWRRQQGAFFDIRMFHPNALRSRHSSIPSGYYRHKLQEKREYGEQVREVELASFTALVFGTLVEWERKHRFSIVVLLIGFFTRTQCCTAALWHVFIAPYQFHYYDL